MVVLCCLLFLNAGGQTPVLFDSDETLEFTLRGDLKSLFGDRGEDPQNHPATIIYLDPNDEVEIPLQVKTRGHFRKMASNCRYPPVLLDFTKTTFPAGCLFEGQQKMKLVTPCRGDQYVVHEYLVYKLYNLLTPRSFRARLVKVVYEDSVKNKSSGPYFGMLLEEEEQMAARNLCSALKMDGVLPQATQKDDFLKMAVFQFMIGNTDWSVQYRQNIKLITPDPSSLPSVVPYDFDHAGIVRAPYAKPAEQLELSSTLERRYRGYCMPEMQEFTTTFELFNRLRGDFYAVYQNNPLLSKGYIKQTLKFLDQFYDIINDPKKAEKAFSYPCDKSGTGNVVIKGLKK